MEQLEVINTGTAPGTRVLVVGWEGWEVLMGTLVSINVTGTRATIRGGDGTEHEYFAYAVHVCPEVPNG